MFVRRRDKATEGRSGLGRILRTVLIALLVAFVVGFVVGTILRRQLERPERYIGARSEASAPLALLPADPAAIFAGDRNAPSESRYTSR